MTKLPNTYQEVEYIQSSGTQYIDTGYDIQTGDTVEIKFNMLTYTGGSSGEQWIYSIWGNYNGYRAGVNHGLWETGDGFTYDTTGYDTDIITTGTSSYDFSYSGYLFAQNEEGSVSHLNQGTQRLFYCKISSGGILVRDFVPCYRKSDSVIGLYDLVNDQFYTNQGTGTFTKGANVTYTKYIDRYYLNGKLYGIKFGGGGWQPGADTIAYYPLNGDMNDHSGNGYNGTGWIESYTTLPSGIQVADFDGTSSIETTYTQTLSTEPFTVLGWFKRADTREQYWLGKGTENNYSYLHVGFYPSGQVVMDFYGTNNPSWHCTDTDWHFAAFTYSGTTQRCYYDNNTPQDITKSFNEFTGALWIGSRASGRNKFNGNLSNVIIENKKRTDQEISDYYDLTKSLYGIS